MTDRRRFQLAVVAVCLVAVAMRTLPMYQSPLPFNPDGILHASKAADALVDGYLPLKRMATDDLHFQAFLAVVSTVTGIPPMRVAQPVIALVGAGPVVLGVAVARRLCWHRDWPSSQTRLAAGLAGVLLAVEGLYLHRSMATDEQTLGLFLVPLAVVAAHRAYRTDRGAWWAASIALLAALPPLHNLDTMIVALSLTMLLAVATVRGSQSRAYATLGLLTASFWITFAGYHLFVGSYTPASIIQQTRLVNVPGLLLAWLVIVVLLGAWFIQLRPRLQRAIGAVAFGTIFVLLGINAVTPMFPGTRSTPRLFLLLLLPLALPVGFAIWRFPEVMRVGEGPALFALGGGVFTLVGVSMTAALTPEYLATGLRATTFLHLPVLVAASIGTAAVGANCNLQTRPAIRIAVAGLVVVSAVVSVPVAFSGLSMLTYKGTTTSAEFAATEFAVTNANTPWAADDHLSRIAPAVRPIAEGSRKPVYQWVVGERGPPHCLTLVQQSWATTGAQLFPRTPARLSHDAYQSWRASSNIVYAGGASDPIHAGIPQTGGLEQC